MSSGPEGNTSLLDRTVGTLRHALLGVAARSGRRDPRSTPRQGGVRCPRVATSISMSAWATRASSSWSTHFLSRNFLTTDHYLFASRTEDATAYVGRMTKA